MTTRRQIQDRIVKALALWEPRIAVETVTVDADADDPDAAIATIVYRLVATRCPGSRDHRHPDQRVMAVIAP